MRVAFEQFSFDSGTRELLKSGTTCHLSAKAFTLLERLLAERPNVVTQKALYDQLWPDTFVEVANLHNLVSELRLALGDRDHKIIRTVYGIGFAFAVEAIDLHAAEGSIPVGVCSRWSLVIGDRDFVLPIGPTIVGRGSELTARVDNPALSRHHARITVTRAGISLEDLGSKNGTFVNGIRVVESTLVTASDDIRFGRVAARLIFDESTITDLGDKQEMDAT